MILLVAKFEGTWIGEPVNRVAIDKFTTLHFASGFIYYSITARFIPILAKYSIITILAITWEIFEPMAKEWNPDVFPNPSKDSEINKTFDVLATVLGYFVAERIQNVVVK